MANMNDIVKVATDAYRGNVEKYSVGQSMELLHKALLDAKNRHGQWYADGNETFGENRQKFDKATEGRQRYNARKLVAEFFGVTEYEIRKAIKLTRLIPELSDILENTPKQLNLSCADLIADYDGKTYDGPAQENIL